jgi:hypothetical protein
LPTVDQPLRVAEFDDLFARSVRAIERPDQTTARLTLDAADVDQARDLAGRETSCCSFFAFDLIPAEVDTVILQVRVPESQIAVLAALTARAGAAAGLEI